MKTRDFNYFLPEELIAQTPAEPRDTSRMLVCNREDSRREGFVFRDFPSVLKPEDVLVINPAGDCQRAQKSYLEKVS